MTTTELAEIIYPKILDRLDISQEDQQLDIDGQINETYGFSLKLLYDSERVTKFMFLFLDVVDEGANSIDLDLFEVTDKLTEMLTNYYHGR